MTAPATPATLRFVDLHMHSTASDGALPPEGVVEAASAAGLAAIALTDHDTLGGLDSARAAGARLGVTVSAGVELSALHDGREVHLLGLHLETLDALEVHLAAFRRTRHSRAEEMVAVLNTLGVPVTMEAVLANADGGAIGRPHVARALIDGKWVRDAREAFDRYLGAGRPAFVDKHRLSAVDAITMIHEAGGVAIFAHPGSDGRRERIEPLAAIGLDGAEVKHPSHSADDSARIAALVDFLKLVPSGGSDWHGQKHGTRVIGGMAVPYHWYERQLERAAARRAA